MSYIHSELTLPRWFTLTEISVYLLFWDSLRTGVPHVMSSKKFSIKKAGVSTGFIFIILLIFGVFLFRKPSPWSREEMEKWINEAAERYEVSPNLARAVVWKESRFFPSARGAAGEIGLMQIRALAASEWAAAESIPNFHHEQVLHPATNTLAGTWYLKKMLKRYHYTDKPEIYALADYNAGRQQVLKWIKGAAYTNSTEFLKNMSYPTTKQYIFDVLQKAEEFSKSPH